MSRRLPPVLCLIVLAPALALASNAETSRRPMTVEDLWAMERVGPPVLSPDGRQAAFTVTVYSMEDNDNNGDLWLVPTDGSAAPRRLTWNEGSDASPAWSPDGKRIAFLSKRDDEQPAQLHMLALDGGEAEPITDLPVAVQNPRWFPDGKRIAFSASTWPDLDADFEAVRERIEERKEREEKLKVRATESRLVRYWDHYLTDGKVTHLFVIDLETRDITDLMPGSERLLSFWSMSGSWDVSPTGDEIALSANSSEPPYRKLNFDVFVLPVSGGELVNLTEDNPAWDGSPRYSPDGKHLLYGRNSRPEIAPDFTRFALMDRQSRQVTDLASEWDGQPADWTFSPDGRMVLFHAEDHGRRHLYSIPVDGTVPRLVVRGGATRGAAVGPGGVVVLSLESATKPAELIAVLMDGTEQRSLTAFNDDRLAELDLGTVQDVTFEGADGDPVQMWVVLPPEFDAERKWPLLQLVHGGPHGAWLDAFHYRWNMALFASKGHVVAAVNFHGSTGAGQAFAESILGAHAGKPFTDIMAATDALLEREYIDESRMAAAGGSYGGYMVSWILGHTDRFAAIINHAGVYDLMGQFASDYTWGRANNYGATPWDDPERIDLWSPSRYAAGFETPTLILHGEKDYRVPYTQGLNLYGVLTANGVPARLVIFPDQNHWILKPQSAVVWWDEVFGWLERWAPAGAGDRVRTGKYREGDESRFTPPPTATLDSIADLPGWLGS